MSGRNSAYAKGKRLEKQTLKTLKDNGVVCEHTVSPWPRTFFQMFLGIYVNRIMRDNGIGGMHQIPFIIQFKNWKRVDIGSAESRVEWDGWCCGGIIIEEQFLSWCERSSQNLKI
ncbi:4774_t:CDS:2 [Ambispora leptoticha]|uniref:4774_t:CDS:1 n=1 Tax=Ambispora leptoticha TaxID=144679 RepID=A0A9N8VR28_9GLOM|nr:4774_t:CDS:2 [Ambispora leptoticha]